jgi:hypothetical protein
VERVLGNTFKDIKIEFEDLDGLSWPENSTPSQANHDLPPLEPLLGPGKASIQTTIHETGLVGDPSSPTCCKCNSDRSACQLHRRKLSRSRRTSEINLNLPRVEVINPFAFVPIPSGREEGSDLRGGDQLGALTMRPPSAKQAESQSLPFRVLELPPEVNVSSIGPPPGLPPPRRGLQPLQGVPFPTRE